MSQQFGVHSEVGQLRQAIVHRPGLELSRLTPSNCDELLFDDVLWAAKAHEEHDTFVATAPRPRRHGPSLRRTADANARDSRRSRVRARPYLQPGAGRSYAG